MNSIKRFYLIIFLFYISGLPQRLGLVPQLVNEVLILFFAIPGIFFFSVYLVKFRYKAEMLDFYLLLFLIIYPVFSAIVAKITVGQPLYMGILSFRGLYIILAFYTIYCMNFNELAILSHVNTVNVFIILLVVFLFFILSINDFNTVFRKGTLAIKYGYTSTKGNQFSGYSGLFFISFIYGWVLYFEKHSIKYLILPAGILVCSVFITKARNEIFTICIIPFAMYYLKYKMFNIKFLTITIFLVLIFYITIATDNIVSRSFSGLLHPRDLEFAQTTKDYSAYLRVQEIKDGLKWFLKYPITGVGSISYRYNGGYMGFISNF